MALITVFVLDLNRSEDTIECVNHLLEDNKNSVNVHVLINGSEEHHRKKIEESFKNKENIYIYESKLNLGFAGGVNYLFNSAIKNNLVADFILLLNNDAFVDTNNLSKLKEVLINNEDVGIVGPQILNSKKEQYIAEDGVKFYLWLMQHSPINSGKRLDVYQSSLPREISIVNGTCMMLRTEVFKKTGGFDESFFAYFEDWDLCIRSRELGYRILYVPNAVISHHGSATTGKRTLIYQFLMTRNRYLIARKHLSLLVFIVIFLPYFLFSKVLIKSIFLLLRNHLSGVKGLFLALLWLIFPVVYKVRVWPIRNSLYPYGNRC